jgi:valyl-tRNA synthetase
MTRAPDKPSLEGIGERWAEKWESDGTYRFDRSRTRAEIFSVDTPPPTVSGSLHMGSAFGYVQTDALARYQRMRGREVFYPMGWDDNGLATERRAELLRRSLRSALRTARVRHRRNRERCDLDLRPNFLDLCARLAPKRAGVRSVVARLGLSVDWTLTYTTIGTWRAHESARPAQPCAVRRTARRQL